MRPLPIHKKWILYPVIVLVALSLVTPALADYLGPNRTVTESVTSCQVVLYECQYVAAKGDYREKRVADWSCSNESKPWQAYPSSAPACNSANVGREHWEREESSQQTIVTYPPATIASSLQNCTLQNGWCTTAPQLLLSGSEPVPGFGIFAIEGSLNGQYFACINSSCSVPLNQGSNNFSYWALSSFGDSSNMEAFSAQVDSELPSITGTFSGTAGSNNWYVSPVSFNGSASDSTSGLASFTCSLDGAGLGSCNAITVNTDGLHSLVLTARDNAGNIRTLTQNASIDTQTPVLNAFLGGTLGSNNWYTAATLNASAADPSPGSGLSLFEYNLDGTGWTAFPSSGILGLMNGKHSVDLRVVDHAGHIVSSSKSFWLDTVAPAITVEAAGTAGLNGWYTTNPILTASANDATSGLDVFEYILDNNAWKAYTTPLTLNDGIHDFSLWAQDTAGLVTQVDRTYRVDTRVPQIAGSLSGTPGANGWYISEVVVSTSASDPAPGSGMESFIYILDGSTETPYLNPLTLSEGQHTLQLNATDKAGLSYSTEQTIKVDSIRPYLKIETVLPNWVKDDIPLNGTANDGGSGLSKVEISTDSGQTWHAVTGTDSWNYSWNTPDSLNGNHQVIVRVFDFAGLSTQYAFNTGVDNHPPEIRLPDSWFQWDTVTLDIWDSHSGLAEAHIEITDPEGRWRKRVIELNPRQFPLLFKWDRRFGDGTIAPLGVYDVRVSASDNVGNTWSRNASIKILLDILPAGPTATLQPYTRAEELTPAPAYTATIIPSPGVNQTPLVSVFGVIEPAVQVTPTPGVPPAPRVTPTQTGVLDWLQSLFVPNANEERVTAIGSIEEINEPPQPVSTNNTPVLWGAAAAAAIAAATEYVREEKRKREEEAARQAQQEERRKRIQAQKLEKLEMKWAQEEAWEEAQQRTWNPSPTDGKVGRQEWEESVDWVREQAENRRRALWGGEPGPVFSLAREIKAERLEVEQGMDWIITDAEIKHHIHEQQTEDVGMRLAAYRYAMSAPEKDQEPESNAWENSKAFINEKIVQPVNSHFYQPYIKPLMEIREDLIEKRNMWWDRNVYWPHIRPAMQDLEQAADDLSEKWDENVYQPHLKPLEEKLIAKAKADISQFNEEVYQPHIKPFIEQEKQKFSKDMEAFNKSVYEPFIAPVVKVIDEKVYQPFLQPKVEKIKEAVGEIVTWADESIYEPFIGPMLSDAHQYIYQPLVRKVNDWWSQYGEWVHGALDVVGFIPALGEIADGINGLVYLAEGHTLEASLSLMSMVPLIGDLAKGGKWAIKAGQEVAETVVEKVAKESLETGAQILAKEGTEELVEQVAKETGEALLTKSVKEAAEEAAEKVAKETLEEGSEKIFRETGTEFAKKTTEQLSQEVVNKTKKELIDDSFVRKVTDKHTSKSSIQITKDPVLEGIIKETSQQVDEAQSIVTWTNKYDNLVKKFGKQATTAIGKLNPQDAKILLETLDDDVLEYVLQEGSDALAALSRWSQKDLLEHGVELSLRAKKDAKVLAAVKKLIKTGPIDPKHLTKKQRKLIEEIAANSTQLAEQGQGVLGKWVDISNGFVKYAQDTASLHYNPHPDMWNMLADLGPANQGQVAWLINQQVIQNGINKGLPFEYTLSGITKDSIENEHNAIQAIFSGKGDADIMLILEKEVMPIRMKELQELQKAGYKLTFDEAPNSYILIQA